MKFADFWKYDSSDLPHYKGYIQKIVYIGNDSLGKRIFWGLETDIEYIITKQQLKKFQQNKSLQKIKTTNELKKLFFSDLFKNQMLRDRINSVNIKDN